jgi:hypothetical protein
MVFIFISARTHHVNVVSSRLLEGDTEGLIKHTHMNLGCQPEPTLRASSDAGTLWACVDERVLPAAPTGLKNHGVCELLQIFHP